jgi:hypothetical protein
MRMADLLADERGSLAREDVEVSDCTRNGVEPRITVEARQQRGFCARTRALDNANRSSELHCRLTPRSAGAERLIESAGAREASSRRRGRARASRIARATFALR